MNGIKTTFLLVAIMALFMLIGQAIGGRNGAIVALMIAMVLNFFSYWFSSSIVLKMYNAVPITEAQNPYLYGIVRRLVKEAHMPMPQVCIINSQVANAFATGRNPANGVVAVTTGIMEMLNEEELEGVIAHELSHILNRDTLISTIAASIAGAIMMLANIARFAAIFGGRGNNGRNPLALLVMAIIAPLAATVIQLAISRTREYKADAAAAKLTHKPMALASALQKISGRVQASPMAETTSATAHMFIINPLAGGKKSSLFSTHPDVGDRVDALKKLSSEYRTRY